MNIGDLDDQELLETIISRYFQFENGEKEASEVLQPLTELSLRLKEYQKEEN